MADIFERLLKNYGPMAAPRKSAWVFCFSQTGGRNRQQDEVSGTGNDCVEPE